MHIDLKEASVEQKSIFANLSELYIYDFSEFRDFEIGLNGLYEYPDLHLYWTDGNRYPFLIYVDDNLAGFVLVQQGSPISDDQKIWDIVEFFVMKKYRRKNIGSTVAKNLWNRFKGRWQVRVLPENKKASSFWSHTINQFTGTPIAPAAVEVNKEPWFIFYFDSNKQKSAQKGL